MNYIQNLDPAAYLKFAQEEALKIPDIDANVPSRPVDRVAIIGAGTMGGGIAMSFANAGLPVTLIDIDDAGLSRGLARVKDNYLSSVKRGRLTQETVNERMALITGTVGLSAAANADLIIEAVFEDISLKQKIFRDLDKLAKAKAILATNTSGLDVDVIANVTSRPQDIAGAHFFSPAHVMRLLEVIRSDKTAPDVIATLMQLASRLGKTAVLARIYPGFIGNALFRNYTREAHFLVEEGALPYQVDKALTDFGYAMGIFAVHDLGGNDVGLQTRKAQMATRPTDRRWNDVIIRLCDLGRLGQKTGKGWYKYDSSSRTPHRDPQLEQIIVNYSNEIGITRREISNDEIIKRCLYCMINEGANLLKKKIALRPSDIDIVYVTGYGFPSKLGGPMYYADKIGLKNIYTDIQRFHEQFGFWWKPAPLLKQLAEEGSSFSAYQEAGTPAPAP